MQKIIFLIKSKASFKIIFFYFYQKLLNIFLKKKIKAYKKQNQNFLKNKKISNDYFSMNAFNFYKHIKRYSYRNFNYLEIGSYEGNSAMFLSRDFCRRLYRGYNLYRLYHCLWQAVWLD